MQILQERKIWMRNSRLMNDASEITHGARCLVQAYQDSEGIELQRQINSIFPGLADDITSQFNDYVSNFILDTYLTCLSEHLPTEDKYGRLSMWRAYGGNAGVAIIFNNSIGFSSTEDVGLYFRPVVYSDYSPIKTELTLISAKLSANIDFIRNFGSEQLKTAIFHVLRFLAICTKHPAFCEEKEWRAIASPSLNDKKPYEECREVIHDIPQRVLKIKMEDQPDIGLTGINLVNSINRIIIGPCAHSDIVSLELLRALETAGIPDPKSRLFNSFIPLRNK